MKNPALFLSFIASLVGCSSIESVPVPKVGMDEGLTYYMPKKDFLITIVKVSGKITTVELDTTAAYPDLTKSYSLHFNENWIGKNTVNIAVGTSGLLESSKSVTTSGVSDALKNLGQTLGSVAGLAAPAAAPPADTCSDGTHKFVVDANVATTSACGLSVAIDRIFSSSTPVIEKEAGQAFSGVFYRQAEPYRVKVTGTLNTSGILFSPSNSADRFLPISKTLFSSNEADFGFTDGMPTRYNQTTDGEVIALLKLPADILAAYFGAVGSIFDSFKAADTNETEVLVASTKLELAKQKYQACLEAIKGKDNTAIEQLECGK